MKIHIFKKWSRSILVSFIVGVVIASFGILGRGGCGGGNDRYEELLEKEFVPVDPAEVAVGIQTMTGKAGGVIEDTQFLDSVSFLVTKGIQQGVSTEAFRKDERDGDDEGKDDKTPRKTLRADRAIVLRGKVRDASGNVLPGVRVRALDHEECGITWTRGDGWFDYVCNGGGPLRIEFAKDGFISIVRNATTMPVKTFHIMHDLYVTKQNEQETRISLPNKAPIIVEGPQVQGTNSLLVIEAGTQAYVVLENGKTQEQKTLHLGITSLVNAHALPLILPKYSYHYYGVDFKVRELEELHGRRLELSKPVSLYIANNHRIEDGIKVPLGSVDPVTYRWIGEKSGEVIRIKKALNRVIKEGESYLTVSLSHMSTYEITFPYKEEMNNDNPYSLSSSQSSTEPLGFVSDPDYVSLRDTLVDIENQTIRIPCLGIIDTPFCLTYHSGRQKGYTEDTTIDTSNGPYTGITDDTGTARTRSGISRTSQAGKKVTIEVNGNEIDARLGSTVTWNGLDPYGRVQNGTHDIKIRVPQTHEITLIKPDPAHEIHFGEHTNSLDIISGDIFQVEDFQTYYKGAVSNYEATNPQGSGAFLAGLELDVHHFYDQAAGILYYGDGRQREINNGIITTVAGTGDQEQYGSDNGDMGLATDATLSYPTDVAVDSKGSIYILDYGARRIRKVYTNSLGDQIIKTIGGNGERPPEWDNPECKDEITHSGHDNLVCAQVGEQSLPVDEGQEALTTAMAPSSMAIYEENDQVTIYYTDENYGLVRAITPGGSIKTIAGNGYRGTYNHGDTTTAATRRALGGASHIRVDADGNVYFTQQNLLLTETKYSSGKQGNCPAHTPIQVGKYNEECVSDWPGSGEGDVPDYFNYVVTSNFISKVEPPSGKIETILGCTSNAKDGCQPLKVQPTDSNDYRQYQEDGVVSALNVNLGDVASTSSYSDIYCHVGDLYLSTTYGGYSYSYTVCSFDCTTKYKGTLHYESGGNAVPFVLGFSNDGEVLFNFGRLNSVRLVEPEDAIFKIINGHINVEAGDQDYYSCDKTTNPEDCKQKNGFSPGSLANNGKLSIYSYEDHNLMVYNIGPDGKKVHVTGQGIDCLTGDTCNGDMYYCDDCCCNPYATDECGDEGLAQEGQLNCNYGGGIAYDSSGNLYIADRYAHRIRKVSGSTVFKNDDFIFITDEDLGFVYAFDPGSGQHMGTLDRLGNTLYSFSYKPYDVKDTNGKTVTVNLLDTVFDQYEEPILTIKRDSDGIPTEFHSRWERITTPDVDSSTGYITQLKAPTGEFITLGLGEKGLLETYKGEQGDKESSGPFTYDSTSGKITSAYDPGKASWSIGVDSNDPHTFNVTNQDGQTYVFYYAKDGTSIIRKVTDPLGFKVECTKDELYKECTTSLNGTNKQKVQVDLAADPIWGMQDPYGRKVVVTIYGDDGSVTTYPWEMFLSAQLKDPNNPFTLDNLVTASITTPDKKNFFGSYNPTTKEVVFNQPDSTNTAFKITLDSFGRAMQLTNPRYKDPLTVEYYPKDDRVKKLAQGTRSLNYTYSNGLPLSVYDSVSSYNTNRFDLNGRLQYGFVSPSEDGAPGLSMNLDYNPPSGSIKGYIEENHLYNWLGPVFENDTEKYELRFKDKDSGQDMSLNTVVAYPNGGIASITTQDTGTISYIYGGLNQENIVSTIQFRGGATHDYDTDIDYGYDDAKKRLTTISSSYDKSKITLEQIGDSPFDVSMNLSGSVTGAVHIYNDRGTHQVNLLAIESAGNRSDTIQYTYDSVDSVKTGVMTKAGGTYGLIIEAAAEDDKTYCGGISTDSWKITKTTLGQVVTLHCYDTDGLNNKTKVYAAGVAVYETSIARQDLEKRVTGESEWLQPPLNGPQFSASSQYGYYASGPVKTIDATDNSQDETLKYDPAGNIKFVNGGEVGLYSDRSEIKEFKTMKFDKTLNGEVASKTNAQGTTNYEYDEAGHLRKVTLPNTNVIRYIYDGIGNRIKKTINDEFAEAYLYAGGAPVAKLDANGYVSEVYVWGTDGSHPDYVIPKNSSGTNKKKLRLISDIGRHSVRMAIDEDGKTRQTLRYDHWGNMLEHVEYTADGSEICHSKYNSDGSEIYVRTVRGCQPSEWSQPFGYGGGLYDPQTRLINFGGADYDPQERRFLEPLRGGPASPYVFAGTLQFETRWGGFLNRGHLDRFGHPVEYEAIGTELVEQAIIAALPYAGKAFGWIANKLPMGRIGRIIMGESGGALIPWTGGGITKKGRYGERILDITQPPDPNWLCRKRYEIASKLRAIRNDGIRWRLYLATRKKPKLAPEPITFNLPDATVYYPFKGKVYGISMRIMPGEPRIPGSIFTNIFDDFSALDPHKVLESGDSLRLRNYWGDETFVPHEDLYIYENYVREGPSLWDADPSILPLGVPY